jgi:hypothetical protein
MRKLFGVFGVILGLISAMFAAFAIGDLAGGDAMSSAHHRTPTSVLVGLLVFFGGACVACGYLAWRMFRSPKLAATASASPEVAEQRVLALAAKVGGRITVTEVTARCGLGLADSRAVLDRLVTQGVAELRVAQDGTMVYAILGLLSPEAKAAADDVLAS